MITDQQVRLLRQKRMEGKTQETSAAMAGMSQRSARKWQCGPLPSESKQERWWRTRPGPFDGVWEEEILSLLQGEAAGKLRATTIIDWLEERFPGRFSVSQFRTLQRRLQALRQAQEAGAKRSGPGGLLPPGASAGPRGPDRLHRLQLPGSRHRWPALPPPAVPAGAEPFGLALCRGGHRRDIPGLVAGLKRVERRTGSTSRASSVSFPLGFLPSLGSGSRYKIRALPADTGALGPPMTWGTISG